MHRHSIVGPDGVRLLQFGKASSQGLREIMGSVNGFYQVVHRLARDGVLPAWSVVGDLSAGPRQAAFDWAPYAETMLVVVEPSWQSILTAQRISRIARSRKSVKVVAVGNKVEDSDQAEVIAERLGEDVVAVVPFDQAVGDAERRGVALIDDAPTSAAFKSISRLLKQLSP